jgi:hypothetical protein
LKGTDNDAKQLKGELRKAITSQKMTAVLAATKLSQRIAMIELPGWALEQDSDYADIMTPESDEEDIWELEPRTDDLRKSNPRNNVPRNTFIPEPYLF